MGALDAVVGTRVISGGFDRSAEMGCANGEKAK